MRDWEGLVQEREIRGLIAVGSVVRGEEDHYSDLDLKRYWSGSRPVTHQLLPWGERLLSLTDMGLEEAEAQLRNPHGWVWAASGFRGARVLHDPLGDVAALRELAMLPCPGGSEWAVAQLEDWCEEAHKLLGALATGDEEKALAARFGLVDGLTLIAAVHLGLPISTENRVFAEVRTAMPESWGQSQSAALEGDTRAALRLFGQTAARFPSTPVLEFTLHRLRAPLVATLRAEHRDIYSGMRRELWPDCQDEEMDGLLGAEPNPEAPGRYRGYLAEDPLSGEALGLVELGEHPGGRGHLEGLYVRPAARRRGVGQALIRWAVAELERWGCTPITSDTWVHQKVSQRLHLRCGFAESERDEHEVRYIYRGEPLWPRLPVRL